jgi:hypothetical protein
MFTLSSFIVFSSFQSRLEGPTRIVLLRMPVLHAALSATKDSISFTSSFVRWSSPASITPSA